MRKAKVKSKKAKILVCLSFILFVCFAGTSSAQTAEELDYYSSRIQFGVTELKREALFQLRNFKSEEASRVAIPALNDSSEIVRATAAYAVIFLPQDEAAQVLIPLLRDEAEFVRREAAYALGRVGNPQAVPKLINLLRRDKDREVRTASAVALGKIGDVSAVEELVKTLSRKPKEKEEFLRRAAARSIGQIAEITQQRDLTLLTPESFLPNEFKDFKDVNYKDLVETYPIFRNAVPTLIKSLQNKKEFADVKREAAFALGAIGNASATPVLRANLGNKDVYLAEISEEALLKIN